MCRSSRIIAFRSNGKTQWQIFPAALSLRGAQKKATLIYTKLYKFEWNTFPNNARMKTPRRSKSSRTCLYINQLSFHSFLTYLLNGYDFYFSWGETANQSYITLLKMFPFLPLKFFKWGLRNSNFWSHIQHIG